MGRCFGPLFWRKRPGASPGACYLSSRSMTAARARTQLGSGAWGCRPFAIGSSGSISEGRMASSTASRPGIPRNSMTSKGATLVAMVEAGPTPAVHGVVRWRLIDLAQWVFDEYRISVTKQILSRELRALGYRKLTARPHRHAHDEAAVAAFKKKSRTSWRRSPRPAASHSNSGSKMKPASVRKTRSRDAGRNAARDLLP